MSKQKLIDELALALEVASVAQSWGNPSPFQEKINELLVKAGRKPINPPKKRPYGAIKKIQKRLAKVKQNR